MGDLQNRKIDWNSEFDLTYRSSQTNQSTPFYSALAIAGGIEEVKAEPFIAIGVAAAFWSFCAEAKGLGLRG
jgi:hypothetical protein